MHNWLLSEVRNIKSPNRENSQNSESPNGPRRGLDFIAFTETTTEENNETDDSDNDLLLRIIFKKWQ